MIEYESQILDILETGRLHISTIKPSDWTEENVIMQKPFPGPFRYNKTPYTREIIDCLAPDHPARIISVMKGAQIGFSAGVIYPGIGWIIKNQPGNTLLSVGSPDLIEKSMEKIDLMIDSCGLRPLIKPSVVRNRAGKSGDTNFKKEFPQGYVTLGSANNHKAIRQVDLQYIFMDDFEAVKRSSKESGNTRKLIEQRAAAYADKSKIFFISTPEIKQGSNIEEVYLLGDQRKYLIPCPCCTKFIEIKWTVPINDKDMGGITWKVDSAGRLINDSVGYICQLCAGFFTDADKDRLLNEGYWSPTAEPNREGTYSYHISSLYAPAGMYDWKHYANNYIEACPEGATRKEDLYKSHVNLCLGETYEEVGEAPKANELQKNIRNYTAGIIPEKISIKDGNGEIVLITCACDLNGTPEDARLDYEIVAWSESGSSYSITHGSIGTFVPREGEKKIKEDRERWTYEHHRENSVWPELDKLLSTVWRTESGKGMRIYVTGIDTGHYNEFAYPFIDSKGLEVIGLKGDKDKGYRKFGADTASYKPAKERKKLYLVEVNKVKDELATLIKLRFDNGNDEKQPPGFMNYPTPSDNKYLFTNFFSHYEAEHRVIEYKEGEGTAAKWQKKNTNVQNHMWDCRVYNIVLKEIITAMICKELKIQNYTWADYVNASMGRL
jgi:phage terminase large subunit GpA-like protein